MKVLYIASNSLEKTTLRIEQDITELQRAAIQGSGDPINFIFLPALPFEDVEQQVAAHRPDIVHISAHGGPNELYLANSTEQSVRLSPEALRAVLSSHSPRLVYINACTSSAMAKDLSKDIPYVIGTSADISNFAARKSAVTFYRSLLRGQNLQAAFEASDATAETLGRETSVKTELHCKAGTKASREIFYRLPQLVASFSKHKFVSRSGDFDFEIGLSGASENTMQVAFCTDDETFVKEEKGDFTASICSVVRTNAINGEIWLNYSWDGIFGDFRLYALATTASGRCYSVASTLCEALINFYQVHFDGPNGPEFPPELTSAINNLHYNDGSLLRPASSRRMPNR